MNGLMSGDIKPFLVSRYPFLVSRYHAHTADAVFRPSANIPMHVTGASHEPAAMTKGTHQAARRHTLLFYN